MNIAAARVPRALAARSPPRGYCSARGHEGQLLGSWRGMLTGLMVLALLRRPLVTPARAARTAQLCRPLACRHALAHMSVCTSSEADGDGETAAVLPSVKRSELTEPMKKRVAYQQRYVCAGCDDLLPPNYEVDHIIPLALGGTNGLRNLQALCVPRHCRRRHESSPRP